MKTKEELRIEQVAYAKELKARGVSNADIAKRLGERFHPDCRPFAKSTVRSLLNNK